METTFSVISVVGINGEFFPPSLIRMNQQGSDQITSSILKVWYLILHFYYTETSNQIQNFEIILLSKIRQLQGLKVSQYRLKVSTIYHGSVTTSVPCELSRQVSP